MRKAIMIALILAAVETSAAGVRFLRGPMAATLEQARQEKKPVLIDFMTDWCRWCDTLDTYTYADKDVEAFINGNLIACKVDAEKGEGTDLARRYGVAAYPTVLLVGADGREIDRILGYVPPGPFLATLKDYVHGVNTLLSMQQRVNDDSANPGLRYQLGRKYSERNDLAGSAAQFKQLLALDPGDSLGHQEEAQFSVAVAALVLEHDPAPLSAYVDRHPRSTRLRGALMTLFLESIRSGDSLNAKKSFEQYNQRWPNDPSAMNGYAWNCAQRGMDLVHASELAKSAVALASLPADKAAILDTYATVRFRMGDLGEAIRAERETLDLLKDAPQKDRQRYEETLQKFISAQESAAPSK